MSNIDYNNIDFNKKIPSIPTYVFTAGYVVTADDFNSYITSYINLIAYYVRYLHNNDKQGQSNVTTSITYNGSDVPYTVENNNVTYSLFQDNKYTLNLKVKSNDANHPSLNIKLQQLAVSYPEKFPCKSSYVNNSTQWDSETKDLTFSYVMNQSIYEVLKDNNKTDIIGTVKAFNSTVGNTYGYWGTSDIKTYFTIIQNSIVNTYGGVKNNNVHYDVNKKYKNYEIFEQGNISSVNNVDFKYYLSKTVDKSSLDKANFTYWTDFKDQEFIPDFTGNIYLYSYISNPDNVKVTNSDGTIFDSDINLYGTNYTLNVDKDNDNNFNASVIRNADFNKNSTASDYLQLKLSSKNKVDNTFKVESKNKYFKVSADNSSWGDSATTQSNIYCILSNTGKNAIINSNMTINTNLDITTSWGSNYYYSSENTYNININLLENSIYCECDDSLILYTGEDKKITAYSYSNNISYVFAINNESAETKEPSSYFVSYYYLDSNNNKNSYLYVKSLGDLCNGTLYFNSGPGLGYDNAQSINIPFNIIGKTYNQINIPEISYIYINPESSESSEPLYTVGTISNISVTEGPLAISYYNSAGDEILDIRSSGWAYSDEVRIKVDNSGNNYEVTYVSYKYGCPKIKFISPETSALSSVTKIINLNTFLNNYLGDPNLQYQYSDNKIHWDRNINSYAYFNINTYATPVTTEIINLSTRVFSLTNGEENDFYQFSNSSYFTSYDNIFESDKNSLVCYVRVNPDSNYCIDNPEITIKSPLNVSDVNIIQKTHTFTPNITKEIEFSRLPEGLVLTYSETGEAQPLLVPGELPSFANLIGDIYYTYSTNNGYIYDLPKSTNIPEGIGDKDTVVSYYCYYMILPKEYTGTYQTAYYSNNEGNTKSTALVSTIERFKISSPNEITIYGGTTGININSNLDWSINITEE